jgi:PIN domain nuclease of toxin-antitoxin system
MALVLVDAPLFVAWMSSDPRVGPERSSLLEQAERIALSQGALVEIASELVSGGLAFPLPPQVWLELAFERAHALLLPVTPAVVARAARWDAPGLDVHDRIAAATAVEHDADFATWNPALSGLAGVRYFF